MNRISLRRYALMSSFLFLSAASTADACSSGDFTTKQAAQGHHLFDKNCSACHKSDLSGGEGPALAGSQFKGYLRFSKISAKQILSFISSQMPYQAPGSLKRSEYEDIFAYILQYNGYQSGNQRLDQKDVKCVKMLPYPG